MNAITCIHVSISICHGTWCIYTLIYMWYYKYIILRSVDSSVQQPAPLQQVYTCSCIICILPHVAIPFVLFVFVYE